jgi:hypothetical protein
MIIIGSTAIKSYFPDFPREPKDLDYAVKDLDEKVNARQILKDFEETHTQRVEFLENPIVCKYANEAVLRPDLMLTLKMSHLFWDIDWDKHMFDVQFLLKQGAKYNKDMFEELYPYWNELHGQNKRSDLKMTKEDFFDNALKEFDHDHLHTLLNPEPTYISMLADDAEVEIDEQKFMNSTQEAKENLVKEEVYVMAFERYRALGYRRANLRMLKKYIISHVPMFAAPFVIENYVKLLKPEYDFVKTIEEKL